MKIERQAVSIGSVREGSLIEVVRVNRTENDADLGLVGRVQSKSDEGIAVRLLHTRGQGEAYLRMIVTDPTLQVFDFSERLRSSGESNSPVRTGLPKVGGHVLPPDIRR